VGREKEIERILKIDEEVVNRNMYKKLILINGDRGIGKTRLLNEISFLLRMKGRDICNIEITPKNNVELMPVSIILRQTMKDTPKIIQNKYAREFIEILPELRFQINDRLDFQSNRV